MISALLNKRTNTTHLRLENGQPYCGARIDSRTLRYEVRTPNQINCDRCRGSEALKLYEALTDGGETADAEYVAAKWKPPRSRTR
jgi:hypothetical protein